MGFFEITEIGLFMVVALGLDVFSLHKQQAAHFFHVLREAGAGALDDGNHNRKSAHADQELKMEFADIVDELMLATSAPSDDQDDRTFHCSNVRSASTRRASFSRPWDATRMWRSSMPTLFEQSRTYMRCSSSKRD